MWGREGERKKDLSLSRDNKNKRGGEEIEKWLVREENKKCRYTRTISGIEIRGGMKLERTTHSERVVRRYEGRELGIER